MKRRKREKIVLTTEERDSLIKISNSRTEQHVRVQRAKIILLDQDDVPNVKIAQRMNISRQVVEDCLKKCLIYGVDTALNDLPRSGKPPVITMEDKGWITFLACEKPSNLGYSYELWTYTLLLKHIHEHCIKKGYPNLEKLSRSKLYSILNAAEIKPHKISYYLEKKDESFEEIMADVLHVYKEVELVNNLMEKNKDKIDLDKVTISYDEKPGIQAIRNIAPDLPPEPFKHQSMGRDYEYKRNGTLSLLAGIDLHDGHVLGHVSETHKSSDFIEFLNICDRYYVAHKKIRVTLDNHSAHTSKETRAYLDTKPNRFEFVFTPKHGSWLNIIETFFSKMTRTFLRGLRVNSREELKNRIYKFLEEVNASPKIFRWKYKMDEM